MADYCPEGLTIVAEVIASLEANDGERAKVAVAEFNLHARRCLLCGAHGTLTTLYDDTDLM